jgi:tRNA(Leu) C34 or U34 (ribose-2'-O)-methylase TrmL
VARRPEARPELLADGRPPQRRDAYRYWTVAAIKHDLDTRRRPARGHPELGARLQHRLHRANAFNAAGVHIRRKRWNRRGLWVTDKYLDVHHHATVTEFTAWLGERGIPLVGVDNLEGSVPLETSVLPRSVCLLFGSEGPGLTPEAVDACSGLVHITQAGSTRSLNAGAAAAIAMYHWALRWAGPSEVTSGAGAHQ